MFFLPQVPSALTTRFVLPKRKIIKNCNNHVYFKPRRALVTYTVNYILSKMKLQQHMHLNRLPSLSIPSLVLPEFIYNFPYEILRNVAREFIRGLWKSNSKFQRRAVARLCSAKDFY